LRRTATCCSPAAPTRHIIDVHDAGTSHQSVAFTQIQGVPAGAGLDDVIKVDASAGTFSLSDTADNRVLAVHATGLDSK
jgi:hypothetical protein